MTRYAPDVTIPCEGAWWPSCRSPHRLLLIMLAIALILASALPAFCDEKPAKEPITREQIEQEFAAAARESRPVKIENRVIEGTALEYLNDNLAEGPGITLSGCEIKGDLDFVKHARPVNEVEGELDEKVLKHVRAVRAVHVQLQVIRQMIRIQESNVHGSLIACTERSSQSVATAVTIFQMPILISGRVGKDALFSSILFSHIAFFSSTHFSGYAKFDEATFSGEASFEKATFTRGADFREACFSGGASFVTATFRGKATFDGAKFSGEASFSEACFSGYTGFQKATFSGDTGFYRATFSGDTDFYRATFIGKSSFREATFSALAMFQWATFSGEADCDRATFSGGPIFRQVTFSGAATFNQATFSGASFDQATFRGTAEFFGARFGGASFDSATFSGATRFYETVFSERASFWGAHFGGSIVARSVSFQKEAIFSNVLFEGEVDFRGAYFGGPTEFPGARFVSGSAHGKAPIRFDLCTFRKNTDFTNAQFQEAALFSSSVVVDELCFNNVRFKEDLDLSGILLTGTRCETRGALSFVGAKCRDIFFGVSQPSLWEDIKHIRQTPAIVRSGKAGGKPLPDALEAGCFIDLTGAHYSRLLFLDWEKLKPAIEESLHRNGVARPTAGADKAPGEKTGSGTPATLRQEPDDRTHTGDYKADIEEQRNATLAALRLLAKNYYAVGSKSDALKAYGFYREKRLEFQPTFADRIIWLTTGFGARMERLAYWFFGLWLVPWALGYWRPGVVVAADEKAEPPNDSLWNWVGTLGQDPFLRRLHMAGFSLWFSFHTLIPAIEVFGYKRWAPSHRKLAEVIPIRYQTLATIQRISGWLLLPIALAAFSGLFGIR